MKAIVFFVLVFINSVFAQDFIDSISIELCQCIESLDADVEITALEQGYFNCLRNTIERYTEEIKANIKEGLEFENLMKNLFAKSIYCSTYSSKVIHRLLHESDHDSPQDDLDYLFDHWTENYVTLSDNPINHKVGTFIEIGPGNSGLVIIRDTDYQYEIIREIKDTLVYKIKWINDFEYDLEFLGNKTAYQLLRVGDVYKVRITTITDSSFISVVGKISKDNFGTYTGEFKKIN